MLEPICPQSDSLTLYLGCNLLLLHQQSVQNKEFYQENDGRNRLNQIGHIYYRI
jgi:hypothetical protein